MKFRITQRDGYTYEAEHTEYEYHEYLRRVEAGLPFDETWTPIAGGEWYGEFPIR